MPEQKTALWTLAGVGLGFMMPLIGLACISALCFGGFAAMSAQMGGASGNASWVGGPANGPAVAILDVNGVISSEGSGSLTGESGAASAELVPLIGQACANADVKAVLLRVNSPGGSVVASDEIYHALTRCGKPVVAYFGEMAASGGYYVSMAAEHIVANPHTLTGSIGVISSFPEASGLMEKLGVTVAVVKSGEVKDIGSLYRPMTETERAYWQSLIDETYNAFVDLVAEGRGLPRAKVLELADGRVYTGTQALELGLVDSLGYEEDAIAKAAELGGISGTPRLIRYAVSTSLASLLSSRLEPALIPEALVHWMLEPRLEFRYMPGG